jgi:GH24 family phage-related lysozyme (muramidase)
MDKKTAGNLLKRDMAGNVAWIKKNVLVDLTQEQLDALVDIMGHVGHMPAELLQSIHQNMCTDPNAVRDQYLKTALGEQGHPEKGPIFKDRREERVWSPCPPGSETPREKSVSPEGAE